MSRKMSVTAVFVHAVVFALALYFLKNAGLYEGFQTNPTSPLPPTSTTTGPTPPGPTPPGPTPTGPPPQGPSLGPPGPNPNPNSPLTPNQRARAMAFGSALGSTASLKLAEIIVGGSNDILGKT